jgi:hypothetical protein
VPSSPSGPPQDLGVCGGGGGGGGVFGGGEGVCVGVHVMNWTRDRLQLVEHTTEPRAYSSKVLACKQRYK